MAPFLCCLLSRDSDVEYPLRWLPSWDEGWNGPMIGDRMLSMVEEKLGGRAPAPFFRGFVRSKCLTPIRNPCCSRLNNALKRTGTKFVDGQPILD